jgi:hypothetical protein
MAAGSHLRARIACVSLLAVTTLTAASCGGSSSGSRATAGAVRDTVTSGTVTHRPKEDTGGSEVNDDNPASADSGDSADTADSPDTADSSPCALVSRAEAQAILGKPIDKPQEAPLGPTCIYQSAGGATRDVVTLAIESISPRTLKAQQRGRFNLVGHTAYCGLYGQTTTFVPLPGGSVLTVAAPCPVGKLFAAAALRSHALH